MLSPLGYALLAAGLAQAQAQYLVNELSFGHSHR
jgi:mannose-binding lectin 1